MMQALRLYGIASSYYRTPAGSGDRYSVLRKPFANKWLNLAIPWELALLGMVIYVPVLHQPFGTYSLNMANWKIVTGLVFTVFPILEIAKWLIRRGWLGQVS